MTTVDIDHTGPASCKECGQDAYIQLAGSEDYVCAHCYVDRDRPRPPGERGD